MAERYPEAETVLDDELLFDDSPRRSTIARLGQRAEDIVREGEVLAGKYRVERIPGRHGLGVLVQVRHLELGQEVTLKFLVPEACAYPEFVQRFVREARAAVKIEGEHVARVTDVGRLESGAPYMVREYLRGPDLAEVLRVRGPLPVAEAVDYIIQAAAGVAEGHALGVVHRNLRPTSLVVVRRSDGTALVKVFDFAASESLHVNPFTERAVSLVGTSAIMASLPYLAPEQIRDPLDVDFRADIYSLGAVLFELLTGGPVYGADAAPALVAQVAADAAPSLRNARPDLPGELDHVVLRCLAKNRAIRYSSLAELALALRSFASPDLAVTIERILRLGTRTSKLPPSESRIPLPPPPVAPPVSQSARARTSTLPLPIPELPPVALLSVHDDVTTINPRAARMEPLELVAPRVATPQPPPLRSSVPPPLREAAATPLPETPPIPRAPEARSSSRSSSAAPPRSSMSGLTRSWTPPEEPAAPLFTPRRLATIGAVAAGITLAVIGALRSPPRSGPAAAAHAEPTKPLMPPIAAEPAPAPSIVAAEPAPSASAPVAVLTAPVVAPAAAAPTAPALAANVAAVAPIPAAALRPAKPSAMPTAAPARKPTPTSETVTKTTPTAGPKLASAGPSSGDLFDAPK
jgi:serine/threonine-protein kinase